jgi:hypothetical protein
VTASGERRGLAVSKFQKKECNSSTCLGQLSIRACDASSKQHRQCSRDKQ